MADKNKVIIFDDGTDASKVLAYECEQNPSIEVNKVTVKKDPEKIESYIKEIAPTKEGEHAICYVPFTMEDFVKHDIDKQRNELVSKYPNVSVFYAYEFMTNEVVAQRSALYGLNKKDEVIEPEGETVEEDKKAKSKKEK